ncbi:hypothetical protein [Argonema antarcticum]|uniref:hypothetical protein n=1 Tax=Argonema antarcticum TaxID=2942763 RepID=UPI002011ABB0|nr:hypothetical protein [Argonema antarcticum]MCL1473598.1 hypothetical protein [Argonema antarcticum A004/B2]
MAADKKPDFSDNFCLLQRFYEETQFLTLTRLPTARCAIAPIKQSAIALKTHTVRFQIRILLIIWYTKYGRAILFSPEQT